ncbi:hypothetical protein GARCT_01367 [Geobacillus sp. 12AMOR1]|nr:hypothetical protein GARCT_01367 [Geobacillus sp. 12AMOR1]
MLFHFFRPVTCKPKRKNADAHDETSAFFHHLNDRAARTAFFQPS